MSTEIILTFAVLGITIFLFVSEWLRVDVVALCVMLALPWLGLVEPNEALAGLSSNAVFSIINSGKTGPFGSEKKDVTYG